MWGCSIGLDAEVVRIKEVLGDDWGYMGLTGVV